jgi:hypothetical protein
MYHHAYDKNDIKPVLLGYICLKHVCNRLRLLVGGNVPNILMGIMRFPAVISSRALMLGHGITQSRESKLNVNGSGEQKLHVARSTSLDC